MPVVDAESAPIPTIPPLPSPVMFQRYPAERCSSPPGPATAVTASARVGYRPGAENRSIAAAARAAATRRNESSFLVPDTAMARLAC
ncbi:hypothetical protein N7499_013019 [Penicillium canescens]|nr:hypothetical protein N7499_013019 [Penicillium canescens]KAJ6154163.1 hypothetical protein N7485_012532 [Penicillium canescens]